MERWLVGVDGGGTHTRALAADVSGQASGRGQAGTSNLHVVGADGAAAALEEAIQAAFKAAGSTEGEVAALVLGMAGIDHPEEGEALLNWARHRFPKARVTLVNDARIVIAAGCPLGWGLAVISGTGSIIYGQSPDGRLARAGGWGYLLGDEGSGFSIGQKAVIAVLRAYDGRGEKTLLSGLILSKLGLKQPPDLVPYAYAQKQPNQSFARISPLVEAAADTGDAVAYRLLEEAGAELALGAQAVIRSLALPEPVGCALAGGMLVRGNRVRAAFERVAKETGLRIDPVTIVAEPVEGALALAKKMAFSEGAQ